MVKSAEGGSGVAAWVTDPSAADVGGYVLYGLALEAKTGKVWSIDANTVAPAASTAAMAGFGTPIPATLAR